MTSVANTPTDPAIDSGRRRFVWFGGKLWWRTYREGGYDGYRTWGERVPCGVLALYKAKGYRYG